MKPRVWSVLVSYVAIGILIQLTVAVVGVSCAWWQTGERHWLTLLNIAAAFEQTPQGFVICRLPAHIVLYVVTMGLGMSSRTSLTERLGLRPCRWSFLKWLVVLGASSVPLLCSIAISMWIVPVGSSASFFQQFTTSSATIYLGYLTLVAAFVEELYFRGYLQRRLLQRWSPFSAVLTTAVLFTIAHGATPVILLTVFPIAVWLGVLSWRTNSIWPGVMCHAFFNAVWCGWPLIHCLTGTPDQLSLPMATSVMLLGSLCLYLAQQWMRERVRDPHFAFSTAAECGEEMDLGTLRHRRSQSQLRHPSADRHHQSGA